MGSLRVMGQRGDTKVTWDKSKSEEIENARRVFDALRAQGFLAFKVAPPDLSTSIPVESRGEQITMFDPEAGQIILAAPMRGGRAR